MGIERFFNSLTQIEKIKTNGIIMGLKEKIKSNYVYIDFNSVVHNISGEVERDLNYLLYAIILNKRQNRNFDAEAIKIIEKYSVDINNFSNINFELDQIILTKIKDQIVHITTQLIDPINVKQIYIAFDGVPQMSKLTEQKKRRYNSYVVSELKKKIFEQTKHLFDDVRNEYELNKIGFDRSKITTRAPLMEQVCNKLSSNEFKNEMKMHLKMLEQITISHVGVYGEGEKKIMEDIIKNCQLNSGVYTIYSPDADVVILGLICLNRMDEESNLNILRFNQQSEEYDFVDVKELRKNIFDTIINQILHPSIKLNEITISNDIAFIFSLFGNDFVPRIESIDARNDIDTLINAYCKYLCMSRGQPLIFYENGYRIRYKDRDGLIQYFKILAENEETLLKETYLASTYKNYKKLKSMLGVTKLLPTLKSYIFHSNKLFNKLRIIADNVKDIDDNDNIIRCQVETIAKDINDFEYMRQFMIFEKFKGSEKKSNSELYDLFVDALFKKVKSCIKIESDGKKYYFGKLRLEPYDTHKVDSPFHEKNIKELLPHPECVASEYDVQCYKLEKKLMEYESKLNGSNFELGTIGLKTLSSKSPEHPHYVLYCGSKHADNVESYYKTFFKVQNENAEVMLQNIVYEYMLGLMWTFDFYFNRNSSTRNISKVSTWTYPHHRSPLLSQIVQYVGSIQLKKLIADINESYVDRSEYLNILEHYMYITPKHRLHNIPIKYIEFTNEKKIYGDLTEVVDRIWNSNDVHEIIDCKRINFLNKCNLLTIPHVTYNEYFKQIKEFRSPGDSPSLNVNNIVHKYDKCKDYLSLLYFKMRTYCRKIN